MDHQLLEIAVSVRAGRQALGVSSNSKIFSTHNPNKRPTFSASGKLADTTYFLAAVTAAALY